MRNCFFFKIARLFFPYFNNLSLIYLPFDNLISIHNSFIFSFHHPIKILLFYFLWLLLYFSLNHPSLLPLSLLSLSYKHTLCLLFFPSSIPSLIPTLLFSHLSFNLFFKYTIIHLSIKSIPHNNKSIFSLSSTAFSRLQFSLPLRMILYCYS